MPDPNLQLTGDPFTGSGGSAGQPIVTANDTTPIHFVGKSLEGPVFEQPEETPTSFSKDDIDLTNVNKSDDDSVVDDFSAGMSLSSLMRENPGLTYEQYMKKMAEYSDEWAEKLLDYYAEKQSIDEQNRYTASREDTAYQRLVQDLKAAGLNPAMMYGSSATPQASGSVGHLGLSEGATSRGVNNYEKIKSLFLAIAVYQWTKTQDYLDLAKYGVDKVTSFIGGIRDTANSLGGILKALF